MAYNSGTGVIARTQGRLRRRLGHLSATGGADYNSSTGVISLSNIANSELANSSVTINGSSGSGGLSLLIRVILAKAPICTTQTLVYELPSLSAAPLALLTTALPDWSRWDPSRTLRCPTARSLLTEPPFH